MSNQNQDGNSKNQEEEVGSSHVNYLNLEQEGMNMVQELLETNNVNENTLMHIINSGNDIFKDVNGRNMTYSEMRSLYG